MGFVQKTSCRGRVFRGVQDLLGHKSSRITTHYSAPELENLIDAANRSCPEQGHKTDTMTIL